MIYALGILAVLIITSYFSVNEKPLPKPTYEAPKRIEVISEAIDLEELTDSLLQETLTHTWGRETCVETYDVVYATFNGVSTKVYFNKENIDSLLNGKELTSVKLTTTEDVLEGDYPNILGVHTGFVI